MLLLDQRTLQIKYRVPAAEIYRLSLSPYLDDIAVFHIKAVSTVDYNVLLYSADYLSLPIFIIFYYLQQFILIMVIQKMLCTM